MSSSISTGILLEVIRGLLSFLRIVLIILNTLGGIIGSYIYIVIENIKDKLPSIFKSDAVINTIVIILIILIIFYSFNLNIFNWFE